MRATRIGGYRRPRYSQHQRNHQYVAVGSSVGVECLTVEEEKGEGGGTDTGGMGHYHNRGVFSCAASSLKSEPSPPEQTSSLAPRDLGIKEKYKRVSKPQSWSWEKQRAQIYACYLYGLTLPPDRTGISRTRLSIVIIIQIFVQIM
ncbi:hypothetical protein EVAR_100416_1 [Eumeta japonica]|uniref:Uncharacterized protein n=1 Tax=Eumeta variegata TaxID=151549 RepID=A0A4C2A3S3_EUMVA|nr:hypothetical protein EVAR_100416_1 [Eumeta japonica]